MARRGLSQKQMSVGFLRGVLVPIHYRHEFARRNTEVLVDADQVFARFPMTGAILTAGGGFLGGEDDEDGGPATIADCLVVELGQERGKAAKESMRDALGGFLRRRRVLPLPPPHLPFFPREMGCQESKPMIAGDDSVESQSELESADRLFVVWRSLVEFERFALAEGMVDEPCFMPVVPLNLFNGAEGVHDAGPDQTGRLLRNRLLTAIDSTLPLDYLADHIELLLAHLDVLDKGRGAGESDRPTSQRMTWTSFDLYLDAMDFWRQSSRDKDDKELAIEFHQTRSIPVSVENVGSDVASFRRWLKLADKWVKEYQAIT